MRKTGNVSGRRRGVMPGLGSPEEDTDGDFTHGPGGGVRRRHPTRPSPQASSRAPAPTSSDATPTYVATRTLTELDWRRARLLDGELEPAVADLKRDGDGVIAVLGSGTLVEQLMQLDLVDELRLSATSTTSRGTVALSHEVVRKHRTQRQKTPDAT